MSKVKRWEIRENLLYPGGSVPEGYPTYIQRMVVDAADYDKLHQDLEDARMKLVACGVAALANTEESKKVARIDKTNLYYSASYEEVCDAVDREIILRKDLEDLKIVNQALSKNSLEVDLELETLREWNEHLEATVKERDFMVRHHLNTLNKVEQDLEAAKELISKIAKDPVYYSGLGTGEAKELLEQWDIK